MYWHPLMLVMKPQPQLDMKGGIHDWESVADTQTSCDHKSPFRVSRDLISFVSGVCNMVYLLLQCRVLDQMNSILRVRVSALGYRASLVCIAWRLGQWLMK